MRHKYIMPEWQNEDGAQAVWGLSSRSGRVAHLFTKGHRLWPTGSRMQQGWHAVCGRTIGVAPVVNAESQHQSEALETPCSICSQAKE